MSIEIVSIIFLIIAAALLIMLYIHFVKWTKDITESLLDIYDGMNKEFKRIKRYGFDNLEISHDILKFLEQNKSEYITRLNPIESEYITKLNPSDLKAAVIEEDKHPIIVHGCDEDDV